MKIRDRIKEFRRVKASELHPNPKNWRTHPKEQMDALRGILAEVGFAGAELVRELPDGTLQLIDGHARAEVAGENEVPVLVLDVTESEADKILLTFDPLGAMAEANTSNLELLLRDVQTGNEALADMLTELAEANGILEGMQDEKEGIDDTYTAKIVAPIYEPKGDKPAIKELYDETKTSELIQEIKSANIPKEVAKFLISAAERHTSFHFARIAEFYCHASPQVQDLMEKSGLVIIDFDKAIEYGFVHMTERLGALADLEESELDDGDA